MNNEIIKLISYLLGQRESNSPIDWNELWQNNFDELEEIIINASKNEKLFELGDDFSDNCKVMLECISELNDDTTYPGEDGDENEEERKDRFAERFDTLRDTLDETIEKLKSVLPDSKSMFNYDEQMNQRSKAALDAIRNVKDFESNAEFFIKINGQNLYDIELERLKKIRNEIFNRNAP